MPWCDAGYSWEVAPTPTPARPTPQPVPKPPPPAPTDTCSAEARAKPPQVFAEVRADAPLVDARQMQAKQAGHIEYQSAGNMTVIVQLRSNSSLCMGVSGHTLRNPQTADVRATVCNRSAQLWRRVETRYAQIPSEFGLAPVLLPTGALIYSKERSICVLSHAENVTSMTTNDSHTMRQWACFHSRARLTLL